jgi:dTDP-4-dehydrorhamnose 3,5-epimerase
MFHLATLIKFRLMNIIQTLIPGCFEIIPNIFEDTRGKLVKTFHSDIFKENNLATDFREEYYSVSLKGVLRGLHFQVPPHQHIKCVTCLDGEIFDVVVDLRKGSPAYGKHQTFELTAQKANIVYVPEGCAHGFLVLSEKAIFLNRTTSVFSAVSDAGIRWDSCGIDWGVLPILSEKDKKLPSLDEFVSPFTYLA